MVLLRLLLWLFRYLVSECMMMLVLCLNGCSRNGVVMVLLMISGIFVVCVILVMVVMLVILLCGLLIDLMNIVLVCLLISVVNVEELVGLVKCVWMLYCGSVCVSRLRLLLYSVLEVMMLLLVLVMVWRVQVIVVCFEVSVSVLMLFFSVVRCCFSMLVVGFMMCVQMLLGIFRLNRLVLCWVLLKVYVMVWQIGIVIVWVVGQGWQLLCMVRVFSCYCGLFIVLGFIWGNCYYRLVGICC